MRIVRPATVDAAALIASDVPETVALYNPATSYALGDQVRSDATHRIYESAQGSNLGHALTDAAWWVDMGATNRWAMFDGFVGTQTVGAGGIDVTVNPSGRVDSISLLNVAASTIRVIVWAGATTFYDRTFVMVSDSGITDWYAYFYEPIMARTDLILVDIPLVSAPHIRIIATGTPAAIGAVVVGQSRVIGETGASPKLGITDYSRKEADEFGNYQLVERAFARKGSFTLRLDPGTVDEVYRILSAYRATPILYIADEDFVSTAIFGFYREFEVEIAYPSISFCTLQLEGLT